MADRSLDSLAVRASRKFDPGYEEKREKEIAELELARSVRERVENELEAASREYDPEEED